jgi:hypothetical protein
MTGAFDMTNIIDWLVGESKSRTSDEEFVTSLVSVVNASSPRGSDLQFAVGALRTAVERYLEPQDKDPNATRCHFCGKSHDDVRALMVSAESAICDECVVAALHTISHQRGQFYLRIAFSVFRAVASLGGHLSSWPRQRMQKEKPQR